MSAFDKILPKWPQLVVIGEDVTTEQAKEIIFRTDEFLTTPFSLGGNAREFNKEYRSLCGFDDVGGPDDKFTLSHHIDSAIGVLHLRYLKNDWASCAFIGGPHGIVSPEGKVFFRDNVGKWPEVEDVYNDFVELADAFPFLNLKASLYDREDLEDGPHNVVVSFEVKDGKVEINEEDYGLREQIGERSIEDLFSDGLMIGSPERGLGLPESWYYECAAKVRQVVNRYLGED